MYATIRKGAWIMPNSKVCNLVDDCGDSSGEDHCSKYFKCDSFGIYLPKSKKCDGHFDCLDLTDECNEDCSKQLLESNLQPSYSLDYSINTVLNIW